MEQERFHELRRNTIIIAASNIGSKAMVFLLAPLYTYFLSSEQYGITDLVTSSIGLIVPFLCFDIYEATFRYVNDDKYDARKTLCTSLATCFPGIIIAILLGITIGVRNWIIIAVLCFSIITEINSILSQYLRGLKDMLGFAASGMITAVILFLSSMIFVVFLKWELVGWVVSYGLALIFSGFYLIFKTRLFSVFSIKNISQEYLRDFIYFCLPLVPTAAMWWIMNVSDRYIITLFLGVSATGIYAVANKIPAILTTLERVFYQAWQISSIDAYKNKGGRDEVYSEVFNKYFALLSVGSLGLMAIGKECIFTFFEKDYRDAWLCLALLILAVMIHALAGNLGTLYSTFKDTKGAFYSTLIGSVTNIVLNIIFIYKFGIVGAAVATICGYLVTLIYRVWDVRKFVSIKLEDKKNLLLLLMLFAQLFFYYYEGPIFICMKWIVFISALVMNRKIIARILRK